MTYHKGSMVERDLSILILAAANGDKKTCERMYNLRGVEFLNLPDYDGRTAMHLAAVEGQVEIIKMFIKVGAAIEPRDRWGSRPVDEASNPEAKRLLEFHSPVHPAEEAEGKGPARA